MTDPSGVFHTPDFDEDGFYDKYLDCNWTIVVEPGYIVLLLIQEGMFDLEQSVWCLYNEMMLCYAIKDDGCRFDRIKVDLVSF